MAKKIAASAYIQAIKDSGLSIYQPIEIGDPELWVPSQILEEILSDSLTGISLTGLPLRTRSKVVKTKVCESLGYPTPATFTKTNPRFPGQNFDTYIQKANNLQIWNEELSPSRRYVLIKVSAADVIETVRVVTGDTLAILDTTGTLTQKYQARLVPSSNIPDLVSEKDTENVIAMLRQTEATNLIDPTLYPDESSLLHISDIATRLTPLIGVSFPDSGHDQERNRGGILHKLVCESLGYPSYRDNGQFPDVPNQLLEVKLQTSPTIDLGLVSPDSDEALDMPQVTGRQLSHSDVRYVLFHAAIKEGVVTLLNVSLVTGRDFYSRFPRFGGKVLNKKLQIPLPQDFFSKPKA